ncbi:MAG: hypothetical protein HQL97_01455 [Magnetococcales bacterium]|nr:hypothetical protein [Magnetococcales bacterium]
MVIERCPACSARAPGHTVCRRCGTELHWLNRIATACRREERLAMQALVAGNRTGALLHLEQAMAYRQHPMQHQWVQFVNTLTGHQGVTPAQDNQSLVDQNNFPGQHGFQDTNLPTQITT